MNVSPGAAAPPVQVRGEVLANAPAGSYRVLTVTAPGMAERFRPGHFVAVAVGGDASTMIARRAFSVYEARSTEDGLPAVRFVVAVHGDGTAWLAGLRRGDSLDLVGPLGRSFTLPQQRSRCVLVGGGYGSAPLFSLADRLAGRGCRVDFVLGAATADRVFGADRAARTGDAVTVSTVDGSLGERGVVTDLLPRHLEGPGANPGADPGPDSPAVYTCGPMAMLREVTGVAARRGIAAEVAVEEAMACGIGVCMTCVLPVVGNDGATRMTRACVEGPVFTGTSVRWHDLGSMPEDVVGAAR